MHWTFFLAYYVRVAKINTFVVVTIANYVYAKQGYNFIECLKRKRQDTMTIGFDQLMPALMGC